jgi:formylglycine-generating enzyme required for sulfatase activity
MFRTVGTPTLGVGRWGHFDLAGNVAEWIMDVFDENYYQQFALGQCDNCINAPGDAMAVQVHRGDNGLASAISLRVTARGSNDGTSRTAGIGVRCARLP